MRTKVASSFRFLYAEIFRNALDTGDLAGGSGIIMLQFVFRMLRVQGFPPRSCKSGVFLGQILGLVRGCYTNIIMVQVVII